MDEDYGDNGDAPQTGSGSVVKWMSHRGFGFIQPDDGGSDIFVHSSGLMDRDNRDYLNTNEKVTYELQEDMRSNKLRAVNVQGDGSGEAPEEDQGSGFNSRGRGGRSRGGGYGRGFNRDSGDRDGGYQRGGDRRGGDRSGGRSSGGQVCFQWRDYQSCRFGDDCKFSHEN